MNWFRRILSVGCTGDDVRLVQRKLHGVATGVFDQDTAARVRGFQISRGLPGNGMVDINTATHMGESVREGMVPDWFVDGKVADEQRLCQLLGVADHSAGSNATIRRFQSAHHLPLTGEIDEVTAIAISDDTTWLQA